MFADFTQLFQFSSVAQSFLTLCHPVDYSTPGFSVHHRFLSLLKFMPIELVMQPKHLSLCSPLLLLPSIFSITRVYFSELALCIRWLKCWSFSFSIAPSNEHPGLILYRMDWVDLLEVQGTLKSLLQHHGSKVSILWHTAFFTSPTLTFIHDHWKNHSLD